MEIYYKLTDPSERVYLVKYEMRTVKIRPVSGGRAKTLARAWFHILYRLAS